MGILKKRWFRRTQAVILTGVMLASAPLLPPFQGESTAYADDYYWAQGYLQSMVDQGIMTGNNNGNLKPSDNITRAEFATMINRALGFTAGSTVDAGFNDVSEYDWFYDDINTAAYEGYFKGVGDGMAAPNDSITREAAVTMLCRALKLQTDPLLSNSFNDNNTISNWSRPYINLAVSKGIIGGYGSGDFMPSNSITRAEVAKVLGTLTGTIVDDSRQVRLDYVPGNVTLTASGGGLRNTVIEGDLYITDGVDTGFILLDNVTVKGQVIVSGSGESNSGDCSIIFRNCDINELVLDVPHEKNVSISTQGNTIISSTVVKSDAFIESGNDSGSAFRNLTIDMAADQVANLVGVFDNVLLKGASNTLNLQKGSAQGLTVDEGATDSVVFLADKTVVNTLFCDGPSNITGLGDISDAHITTSGTVIEGLPENITIRPGITANINGEDMTTSSADTINLNPMILSGYPKISDQDVTSAKAAFEVNKPGKLYWIVIPDGFAAPTSEQMINPKLIGSAVLSGNLNVTANAPVYIDLKGLTLGTDYQIYGMLVDSYDVKSAIKHAAFSTIDNTAPKFTYNTFAAQTDTLNTGEKKYSIAATATVSKDATVYYAAVLKGGAAPSATELVNQKVSAAAKGFRTFSKNVTGTVYLTNLKEKTDYDVYMIAVDDSGRQSTIVKASLSTDDTTAPELLRLTATPGDTNISYKFVTNEDCAKIYWAIYFTNSPTVTDIEKNSAKVEDGLMWYESDDAVKAVIKASGAVQSGDNVKASANKDATLNVQNLDTQRYYKLYMVLEDASGNQSVVYTIEESTVDNVPPTASLTMGSTDGTNLYIGTAAEPTSISLEFSEVVRLQNGSNYFDPLTTTNMDPWIKLYRGTTANITDTSRLVSINWDAVKASITPATAEVAEHTVLTFSVSDSSTTALQLNTGESYTFVLTYNAARSVFITDKSGNSMKVIPTGSAAGGNYTDTTITFKCVEPSVNISRGNGVETQISSYKGLDGAAKTDTRNLDLSYRIKPTEANTAASGDLYYDFYFTADSNLTVNVFRQVRTRDASGTVSTTGWELVGENLVLSKDADMNLTGGQSAMFASITRTPPLVQSTDYENAKQVFKSMPEEIIYALEITRYEFTEHRDSWNGSVTCRTRCVMATSDLLARRANDPASETIDITSVGSADDTISFSDRVPPQVKYSIVSPGGIHETSIDVTVSPDKDVMVYWVAVPGQLESSQRKTTREIYDYIQAKSSSNNIYGAEGTRVGYLDYQTNTVSVDGLIPDTDYHIYFVSKSLVGTGVLSEYSDAVNCTTTINGAAEPQYVHGKTTTLQEPKILPLGSASSENYIEIDTNADTSNDTLVFNTNTNIPANVYWTIVTDNNKAAYDAAIASKRDEIRQPSDTVTGTRLIEQNGSVTTSSKPTYLIGDTQARYKASIQVSGLNMNTNYYIYVIAANPKDENHLSEYKSFGPFQLPDKEPPRITLLTLGQWVGGSYSKDINNNITAYVAQPATVLVQFDKPLYFKDTSTSSGALTKATISNINVSNVTGTQKIWTVTDYSDTNFIVRNRKYTVTGTEKDGGITALQITVSNVDFFNTNAIFQSTTELRNADGLAAGQLEIRFTVDPVKTVDPVTGTTFCNSGTLKVEASIKNRGQLVGYKFEDSRSS